MSPKAKSILKTVGIFVLGVILGTFISFPSIYYAFRNTVRPLSSNASIGAPGGPGGHYEWQCYGGGERYPVLGHMCTLVLVWIRER